MLLSEIEKTSYYKIIAIYITNDGIIMINKPPIYYVRIYSIMDDFRINIEIIKKHDNIIKRGRDGMWTIMYGYIIYEHRIPDNIHTIFTMDPTYCNERYVEIIEKNASRIRETYKMLCYWEYDCHINFFECEVFNTVF